MLAITETHPGTDLWFLNGYVRVALSKSSNEEGISVLEHRLPYGESPPLHMHHDEDELFYLLEGEMQFQIGDDTRIARAGDALVGPRKQAHGFRVLSPNGARLLTITRGGFEAAVRAASRPAQSNRLPEPSEPSPEMQAALGSICAAQGIELLGPPMAI